MSRLVDDWLLEWAARRPDGEAVSDAVTRWTFAELDAASRRVATSLRARGLGEGWRVATLVADTAEAVAAVHALRRLGAVHVPLNRRAAPAELAFQLAAVGANTVVHDPDLVGLARMAVAGHASIPLFEISSLLAESASEPPTALALRDQVDLDMPATIVFTSGTTGRPKGAILTHGNHLASADAWATVLAPRPTDRWLACLPLFHVAGLAMIVRTSRWGVPLEVHGRFDPEAVDRAIEAGVSHLSLVGPMLERLLVVHAGRAGPVAPRALRAVLLGGGPVPPALVTRALELGFPAVPSYGLTETASGVTALSPEAAAGRPGSAGRPLEGVAMRIGPEGCAPVAGEVGEILVRGSMVFAGYEGLPDESARVLHDGWLHTGDLGSLDAGGNLVVLDRRDDLLVSGGENVYPAEVEAVLVTHPAVMDAAVMGLPDPTWGTVPVAAIVLGPGADVADDALTAHCRERLAGYKVPVAYRRLSALPRTPAGKLLRRGLREALLEGLG